MRSFIFALILLIISGPIACAASAKTTVVKLEATKEGSPVAGNIQLEETPEGLKVTAEVQGASPGKHGFHFHENGSCAEEGSAAGGHFNPDHAAHGLLTQGGFSGAHAGDMGNIEIGADGTGKLETVLPGLNLTEGKYNVTGKAVIFHEKEDDFGQPTGNAGGRIGCGVIMEQQQGR